MKSSKLPEIHLFCARSIFIRLQNRLWFLNLHIPDHEKIKNNITISTLCYFWLTLQQKYHQTGRMSPESGRQGWAFGTWGRGLCWHPRRPSQEDVDGRQRTTNRGTWEANRRAWNYQNLNTKQKSHDEWRYIEDTEESVQKIERMIRKITNLCFDPWQVYFVS